MSYSFPVVNILFSLFRNAPSSSLPHSVVSPSPRPFPSFVFLTPQRLSPSPLPLPLSSSSSIHIQFPHSLLRDSNGFGECANTVSQSVSRSRRRLFRSRCHAAFITNFPVHSLYTQYTVPKNDMQCNPRPTINIERTFVPRRAEHPGVPRERASPGPRLSAHEDAVVVSGQEVLQEARRRGRLRHFSGVPICKKGAEHTTLFSTRVIQSYRRIAGRKKSECGIVPISVDNGATGAVH